MKEKETDPIMPFGKHGGKPISDIPVEYLDWLIGEQWFVTKFYELAEQIERHLEGRVEWQRMDDD